MLVEDIDPANIGDERLRRFHAYWNDKRGTRLFPRRGDIDPVEFPYLLGQIALVDITDDPRVYRWRLVGNWWREKFGIEATGMWVDDWPFEQQRRGVRTAYDRVRAARRPHVFARSVWLDGRKLACETLMLPMSENGADVSMIVVALAEI
ncbi:MAG: PAS domain-containing protein [Proteobacteria bacterium]|nr:PAS domain-containing protein [Pseudomonadota bacterium]